MSSTIVLCSEWQGLVFFMLKIPCFTFADICNWNWWSDLFLQAILPENVSDISILSKDVFS